MVRTKARLAVPVEPVSSTKLEHVFPRSLESVLPVLYRIVSFFGKETRLQTLERDVTRSRLLLYTVEFSSTVIHRANNENVFEIGEKFSNIFL